MNDFGAIEFSCLRFEDFSRTLGSLCRSLPPEIGKQLFEIYRNYFASYGIYDAFDRMNNRTVAQIFAEYQAPDVKPIASGTVAGVRYDLYEATESDSNKLGQDE